MKIKTFINKNNETWVVLNPACNNCSLAARWSFITLIFVACNLLQIVLNLIWEKACLMPVVKPVLVASSSQGQMLSE